MDEKIHTGFTNLTEDQCHDLRQSLKVTGSDRTIQNDVPLILAKEGDFVLSVLDEDVRKKDSDYVNKLLERNLIPGKYFAIRILRAASYSPQHQKSRKVRMMINLCIFFVTKFI